MMLLTRSAAPDDDTGSHSRGCGQPSMDPAGAHWLRWLWRWWVYAGRTRTRCGSLSVWAPRAHGVVRTVLWDSGSGRGYVVTSGVRARPGASALCLASGGTWSPSEAQGEGPGDSWTAGSTAAPGLRSLLGCVRLKASRAARHMYTRGQQWLTPLRRSTAGSAPRPNATTTPGRGADVIARESRN